MYTEGMLRKSSIALGATLTLVGSMIALPGIALAAPGDAVVIADAHLREAVKAAVGHQPDNPADPTEAEMATISNLDLANRDIANLDGIQYATNLTSLNLSGNSVGDISPLTNLSSLSYVNLSLNPINSIAPLAGKTSLTTLNLASTDSDEAAAETTFASLPNLDTLNVSKSNLGEEVVYAHNLIELVVDDNLMTNLNGYEALTKLKSLSADNNPLESLAPLQGRDFDYLSVGVSKVRDLSGITATDGQVTSEVPISAGVGEAVDTTVTGVGASGVLPMDAHGNGTYDSAAHTVTYSAAGDYQLSWSQQSGSTFQFTGNLNIGVENTAPSAVSDFEVSGRVGSANLRWAQPNTNGFGSVTGYNISVSNDGFVTSKDVTAPANATSAVVEGLAGGDYAARITYTTSSGGVPPESVTAFSVYAAPFPAPTNLNASYQSSTDKVTFTWDGVDAPSYILTVTDDGGKVSTFTVPASFQVGQTFTVPSAELFDNTRYTFKVEAGDDEGSLGVASSPTVFNPTTGYVGPLTSTLPATNIHVESYDAAAGTLTLGWDAPADAERFSYRLVGQGGVSGFTTGNTVTLNVLPNEDYTFELASRTASSSYSASTPYSITTPNIASVTGVTATLGNGDVVLNWNPVPGAVAYEVTVLGEAMNQPTRTEVAGNTATVLFAGYAPENKQFEIAVRAKAANGTFGGYSTIMFVNPGASYAGPATSTLAAVTDLKAVFDEATQSFLVTWTGDEAADRYLVNFNNVDKLFNGDENSTSLIPGVPGTTQSITVYQRGIGGAFGPAATVQVTNPDSPVVPGHLTATVNGKDILVNWPAIPGATGYRVSTNNIGAGSGDGFTTTTNSATLSDMVDQTFAFRAQGVDAAGDVIPGITYSGIWNAGGTQFLDITAPPAAVENGKVTVEDAAVDVTWDSNGADFYRVYATSDLGFVTSPVLTGDVTSYRFDRSQFPAGSTWTFTLVARNASSVFSAPSEAEVTFPSGSGSDPGNGNSGSGTGSGGSNGDPAAVGSSADPVKYSGEGDLLLILGGGLALGGIALMASPLIRRKKNSMVKTAV